MARTKQCSRRNAPRKFPVTSKKYARTQIFIDLTLEPEVIVPEVIDLGAGGNVFNPIILDDSEEEALVVDDSDISLEIEIDPEIMYTPPLVLEINPFEFTQKELEDDWFPVNLQYNHYDCIESDLDLNLF